ncbi:hypothetical protein SK128_020746 [Halocaridina rubra]|uniref:Protein kinase domain-containing protein n=1 Tax=Halocaridina rubra TaxID=373956 RepID=A0AAN9A239_HALRR
MRKILTTIKDDYEVRIPDVLRKTTLITLDPQLRKDYISNLPKDYNVLLAGVNSKRVFKEKYMIKFVPKDILAMVQKANFSLLHETLFTKSYVGLYTNQLVKVRHYSGHPKAYIQDIRTMQDLRSYSFCENVIGYCKDMGVIVTTYRGPSLKYWLQIEDGRLTPLHYSYIILKVISVMSELHYTGHTHSNLTDSKIYFDENLEVTLGDFNRAQKFDFKAEKIAKEKEENLEVEKWLDAKHNFYYEEGSPPKKSYWEKLRLKRIARARSAANDDIVRTGLIVKDIYEKSGLRDYKRFENWMEDAISKGFLRTTTLQEGLELAEIVYMKEFVKARAETARAMLKQRERSQIGNGREILSEIMLFTDNSLFVSRYDTS